MLTIPRKSTGSYPEREESFERWTIFIKGLRNSLSKRIVSKRMLRFPLLVHRAAEEMGDVVAEDVPDLCRQIGWLLLKNKFDDASVAKGFALVQQVAARELGQYHYDVQLMGGWCLLHGMVAEMETGEGKTLTATLAASLVAMAGIPVHVITPNDYLTQRDAESMLPLYTALGLRVDYVVHDLSSSMRRKAYAADITYCTNKEIAFDYLRDRIETGNQSSELRHHVRSLNGQSRDLLLLRGLHFAIVDEADSVLIDESRTPLIITDQSGEQLDEATIRQAFLVADMLKEKRDFLIPEDHSHVELNDHGKMEILNQVQTFDSVWKHRARREELVSQALAAKYLYHRGEHYIVDGGKVQIIDQYTGRIMEGRSWGQGLQQMIEFKEDCEASMHRMPKARISYQRFFRRYMHLAGMTGTAKEVSGELWTVYMLSVMCIPTHRTIQREVFPSRVLATKEQKYNVILERIRQIICQNRPVLVGTRCLASSEELSRKLSDEHIEHQLINARQGQKESEIIALAGRKGQVTIATNMAGRGTDIKLADGVVEHGGLHVILSEIHEAGRIDRQLIGRCGRQGDPGSYEMILSVDDTLFNQYNRLLGKRFWQMLYHANPVVGSWIAFRAGRFFQRRIEAEHFSVRKDVLKMDQKLGDVLAFSGHLE